MKQASLTLKRALRCCSLPGEVGLAFLSAEEMRDLNLRFRGADSSTDVLTFPSGLPRPHPLGDIAISVPDAQRQAGLRGVSLQNEVDALIIHGVLHLAGFDDETEEDRLAMQREMARVAEQLDIQIDPHWTSLGYHHQP